MFFLSFTPYSNLILRAAIKLCFFQRHLTAPVYCVSLLWTHTTLVRGNTRHCCDIYHILKHGVFVQMLCVHVPYHSKWKVLDMGKMEYSLPANATQHLVQDKQGRLFNFWKSSNWNELIFHFN